MLRQSGFRVRYVNFGRTPQAEPALARYDGLVVLGGSMNLDEIDAYPHLGAEMQIMREALKRDLPVLGICLGAQLLSAALGARVRRNPIREIGWYRLDCTDAARSDPLCRHLCAASHVFEWHGYTFDLPAGAVHLASTASCRQQAFRFGERAYGLQFHLEADAAQIRSWLRAPSCPREIDPEQIVSDTQGHVRAAVELGQRVFGEFIQLFAWRAKLRLASR